MKYNQDSKELPKWVQLMYSEKPNEGRIIEEYNKFYITNEFVKNQHTQYYKRWIRSLSRTTNLNTNSSKSKAVTNGNVLVLGILIKTQIVEVMPRISSCIYRGTIYKQSKYSIRRNSLQQELGKQLIREIIGI